MTLIICLVVAASVAAGDDFYDSQLNRGIRNSDSYSYSLVKQAHLNKAEAGRLLNNAVRYSPDLPAVYFEHAKKSFSPSGPGLLKSVDYVISGIDAYSRNFWWSFSLTGAFYFSLLFSFILSYIVILLVRLSRDVPMITHDIREASSRFFLLFLLLAISCISPLFFLAGSLILIGFYMRKMDRFVVYAFLILLLFSPAVFSAGSLFINSLSSGKLKAVVHSNESRGNMYALTNLKDNNDYNATFSYALALKHEGNFQEAIEINKKLLDKKSDPRVLVNLGNCYVGLYNFEEDKKGSLGEAARYYTMAINAKPSASAYYNLSEVSREILDFQKGNEYFKAALNIDRAAVENYRAISSRNTNRFVIDETIPRAELWDYAKANSNRAATLGMTVFPAPAMSFVALLLIPAFYILPGRFRYNAYRCRKCEAIHCSGCERELVIGQICSQCYGSMIKLAELDVKERVSRILSIYDLQARRRNIMKILSFVLPGAAHIYSGKILHGFLMLWPFLFLISFPIVSSFFFPGSSLISHGFFSVTALGIALLVYVASNLLTRQGISKGWL
jgi:tetratricopeptide (TPR) repeat protein